MAPPGGREVGADTAPSCEVADGFQKPGLSFPDDVGPSAIVTNIRVLCLGGLGAVIDSYGPVNQGRGRKRRGKGVYRTYGNIGSSSALGGGESGLPYTR